MWQYLSACHEKLEPASYAAMYYSGRVLEEIDLYGKATIASSRLTAASRGKYPGPLGRFGSFPHGFRPCRAEPSTST
ncbi:MAG: hypothetical protein M1115_09805 [Actinobacteria bacterium]|nr:hypothetical protein [Actinomycetota bacterium]